MLLQRTRIPAHAFIGAPFRVVTVQFAAILIFRVRVFHISAAVSMSSAATCYPPRNLFIRAALRAGSAVGAIRGAAFDSAIF